MELTISIAGFLMLVAALVAILSRRYRFPYTIGLLVTGIGLSQIPTIPIVHLNKDLIFSVLLPPLIFEAALSLPWLELRKVMLVSSVMASLGLLLSAAVTAVGMMWILGWPPLAAGAFGALIAATDPVSVIATFKESGVTGTLRVLVESESLFNDGTAAVLFGLLMAFSHGAAPTIPGILLDTGLIIGGGIACGAVVALGVMYLAGKSSDHLVELTLTTVVAYGSFLIAERLHCSGILATLTAGLIVSNVGPYGKLTHKGREAIEAFWEFAGFVANSLIFILIGMQEAEQHFTPLLAAAGIGIAMVMIGRACAVYPVAAIFSRTRYRLPQAYRHILFWGGLRGALALALALALPDSVPLRSEIQTVTFAVVSFSIVIQGLTMRPLLSWFRLLPMDPAAPAKTPPP